MLIAIGLTMAVTGVHVLFYAIDTLGSAADLEIAHAFADRVHNVTSTVDRGLSNSEVVHILVPRDVTITADGHTLTIAYESGSTGPVRWSEEYSHNIVLVSSPEGPGMYILNVSLLKGDIRLVFNKID